MTRVSTVCQDHSWRSGTELAVTLAVIGYAQTAFDNFLVFSLFFQKKKYQETGAVVI
jgi:hypothetical protein